MNMRALLIGLIVTASVVLVGALTAGSAFVPALAQTVPSSFRVISWDALAPKDWDPLKQYRDSNVGLLMDGDPKLDQMMRDMRAAWDNAPTVSAMNGAAVKLAGYVVPLDEAKGGLKEFLLVPYFGACIHTPPPPANQIIHVISKNPVKGFRTMDTVWVSGTLSTRRQESMMGTSGYRMDAVIVDRYAPPSR